jgi:hypothetical protein
MSFSVDYSSLSFLANCNYSKNCVLSFLKLPADPSDSATDLGFFIENKDHCCGQGLLPTPQPGILGIKPFLAIPSAGYNRQMLKHFKGSSSNGGDILKPLFHRSATSGSGLSFAQLNCRSVVNKTIEISEIAESYKLDVFALTESWLFESDSAVLNAISPPHMECFCDSRQNRKGGGVVLLVNKKLKPKRINLIYRCDGCEMLACRINAASLVITILVVYRPPNVCSNLFLEQLQNVLAELVVLTGELCIVGDFNYHVDSVDDFNAPSFNDTLSGFGLQNKILLPTHDGGHTLDLVIVKDDSSIIKDVAIYPGLADHKLVFFKVCGKPMSEPNWSTMTVR